ncbi:hypothetical protein RGB72_04495 [Glutamicibacter protophormiae]|nr:hypothetical protein RGB72_04495 [Glutamicibacter protophormiae]
MTQPITTGGGAPEETVEVVSALLSEQSRKIRSLSRELADSYQKELAFFDNLESRDRQLREQEHRFLKKIWWLESELRKERGRADRAQDERDAYRAQVAKFRAIVPSPLRSGLRRARKVVRSWR